MQDSTSKLTPLASVIKRVFIQNLSSVNKFHLFENESEGRTHFPMNGFAHKLVLTQKQEATRKGCIVVTSENFEMSKTSNVCCRVAYSFIWNIRN